MKATVWRTVEIELTASHLNSRPYVDVDVIAEFTGPGGRTITRPAFWDGGSTWRVRFAPPTVGEWNYRTVLRGPEEDAGLSGVSGRLEAEPAFADSREVYRRGFPGVAPGATILQYSDGSPFFWLGDTHWRLAFEKWDEANKEGWSSQFRGMVDKRVEQGFTVYQTNVLSFGDGWDQPPVWDPDRTEDINVAFFQNELDKRLQYIADAGLVNALGLGWYQLIDEDPAVVVRLARYFVARYGSYPIVWTLGGEVAGYDPSLREKRLDGWRQVARAIAEADGYQHPIAAHLTNERPIAPYFQGEGWLSFTLNQLGHGDLDMDPRAYREHLSRYPSTPLVEGESMYEGITTVEPVARRPATDTIVRQVAYRAFQSGCCGYTYGAQGCWNNAWEYRDSSSLWGDLPWHAGIDLPGAEQLGHLRRFYEAAGWSQFAPVDDIIDVGDPFNEFYRPLVTATPDRRHAIVYFGETFRSSALAASLVDVPAGEYRRRWWDPVHGGFVADSRTHVEAGRLLLPPTPESGRDWILLVEPLAEA